MVTVVPKAWSSNNRNPNKVNNNTETKETRSRITNVPKEDALPKGHTVLEMKSGRLGYILGKKHANILRLVRKYPGTKYSPVGESLWIWGPEEKVDSLQRDIELNEKESIEKFGPAIPTGVLPAGHTQRCMEIPEIVFGHIVGKHGKNIEELRECNGSFVSIG